MTPLLSTPWLSTPWITIDGKELPVRALPGLAPASIKTLESGFPGLITPAMKQLLEGCCGLADSELGHVDFTGCCFPAEPCAVFNPCLTLAIDDCGRRFIAEVREEGLPGPVWCVFPDPEVALHVSDDLQSFVAALQNTTCRGECLAWLRDLNATASAVWSYRRALALRPFSLYHSHEEIRGWLSCLPPDAYVYDLRRQHRVRGWPYGVAGPAGRLYRCGRLPVFAVAGTPAEGWHAGPPETTLPVHPVAALAMQMEAPVRDSATHCVRTPLKNVSESLPFSLNASGWSRCNFVTFS
jgi:hypothetical protein